MCIHSSYINDESYPKLINKTQYTCKYTYKRSEYVFYIFQKYLIISQVQSLHPNYLITKEKEKLKKSNEVWQGRVGAWGVAPPNDMNI